MRNSFKRIRGFTLIEILVAVAILAVLVAIVAIAIARVSEEDVNTPIIRQANDYIAALEESYDKTYERYPAIFGADGKSRTTLDQYGCLVDTISPGKCSFNGSSEPLYPDKEGMENLAAIAQLVPLAASVIDQQGDEFDSIMYSSNGSKFRIQYPLVGDDVGCGIQYAYEVSSGSSEYQGVTICVYESR